MAKSPLFVVPVDFSPDMEGTVSAAFALARRYGAEVHLLEVVSPRGASFLDDAPAQGGSKGNRSRLEHAIKAAAHAPIRGANCFV